LRGQHLQGGRAVHHDIIIAVPQAFQRVPEDELPAFHAHKLDGRPGQLLVGGEHVPVFRGDHRVGHLGRAHKHVVNGGFDAVFVHAHARGGVALGVNVAQQDGFALVFQGAAQVGAGGGFAHPAFLVRYRDDFAHRRSSVSVEIPSIIITYDTTGIPFIQ
jgi:hypothetical protein